MDNGGDFFAGYRNYLVFDFRTRCHQKARHFQTHIQQVEKKTARRNWYSGRIYHPGRLHQFDHSFEKHRSLPPFRWKRRKNLYQRTR